ncbi:MAG: hypothetical protein FWF28_08605, partial [Micrococcales bacterium]|nr:hypothetical protein [Micrococcales bacterium]
MVAIIVVGVITYAGDLTGGQLTHGLVALGVGGLGCAVACLSLRRRLGWCRWVALALVALAPQLAGLFGVDPMIQWNMAVFTACLLTMDAGLLLV